MYASKENAAKALKELDKNLPNYGFVREFIEAAQRKLPREEAFIRDKERSRK